MFIAKNQQTPTLNDARKSIDEQLTIRQRMGAAGTHKNCGRNIRANLSRKTHEVSSTTPKMPDEHSKRCDSVINKHR